MKLILKVTMAMALNDREELRKARTLHDNEIESFDVIKRIKSVQQ